MQSLRIAESNRRIARTVMLLAALSFSLAALALLAEVLVNLAFGGWWEAPSTGLAGAFVEALGVLQILFGLVGLTLPLATLLAVGWNLWSELRSSTRVCMVLLAIGWILLYAISEGNTLVFASPICALFVAMLYMWPRSRPSSAWIGASLAACALNIAIVRLDWVGVWGYLND